MSGGESITKLNAHDGDSGLLFGIGRSCKALRYLESAYFTSHR